jgi:hypothetical protein
MRRLYWAVTLAAFALAMPLAALADDQEVANQIAESMKTSGRMKDYKVGVKVQEGTAWLRGTVASQEQWTTAQMIAEDTYGIDRVVNNLTVADSKLAEQSGQKSAKLHQPASVANAAVNPSRHEGVVRASMELPDHAKQELAIAGPMPQMRDDAPLAAQNGTPMPMTQPMPAGQPTQMPMAQPMQMPMAQQMPMSAEQQAYMMAAHQAQQMPQPGMRKPMPLPIGARGPYPQPYQQASQQVPGGEMIGTPRPMPMQGGPVGTAAPAPMRYDSPSMPNYAWPSYAAYPNYAALTYPKQYSPTAWPYIGPFYPYPQVPLGWRKVTLEWDDGWWFLDFKDSH